jgi:hypothetical protein
MSGAGQGRGRFGGLEDRPVTDAEGRQVGLTVRTHRDQRDRLWLVVEPLEEAKPIILPWELMEPSGADLQLVEAVEDMAPAPALEPGERLPEPHRQELERWYQRFRGPMAMPPGPPVGNDDDDD